MAYSPASHSLASKAMGFSQATPTDARSYFYDAANFIYRPYQNTAEVLAYLNLAKYRTGNYLIFINSTGVLNPDGTFTGGIIEPWWFRNGTADANLKQLFDSVNLLGIPTAPTAAPGTNTIQIATTEFVMAAVVASTTGVASFNGRAGAVMPQVGDYDKAMVGLGNVDDTSDADKPISNAQAIVNTDVDNRLDALEANILQQQMEWFDNLIAGNSVSVTNFDPSYIILVYRNGLLKRPTIDYTMSGNVITFTIPFNSSTGSLTDGETVTLIILNP